MPRILMCQPDYFEIEYEINPWMSKTRGADSALALKQWQNLYQTLARLGVEVELTPASPGLPDLVFTANAGLVFKNHFFSSRFRYQERALESPIFEQWFSQHGFEVAQLPERYFFEGAGDALFCGTSLYCGYKIRSDVLGHQWLGEKLHRQVLPLELIHPSFYHLDTCFCPLKPGMALYYPGAFDDYGLRVLRSHITFLIPVAESEALRFGCNAVVVGNHVVVNTGCEKMENDLHQAGFTTHPVDLGEFLKSGGSAKCLILRLDGEDAAIW
ncbi:MAG: amidinotransferase [Gemmataceae bacterium]|nr:amidinotransferase [Gemmataceae bacterium]